MGIQTSELNPNFIQMVEILHKELAYELNGILFDVHNKMGSYCNHKQYCDVLEIIFKSLDVEYVREKDIPIVLNGIKIFGNRLDFLIEDKIVLDVKNKKSITKKDYVQMRRYLKATNKELGIIVNFAEKSIKPIRILNKI